MQSHLRWQPLFDDLYITLSFTNNTLKIILDCRMAMKGFWPGELLISCSTILVPSVFIPPHQFCENGVLYPQSSGSVPDRADVTALLGLAAGVEQLGRAKGPLQLSKHRRRHRRAGNSWLLQQRHAWLLCNAPPKSSNSGAPALPTRVPLQAFADRHCRVQRACHAYSRHLVLNLHAICNPCFRPGTCPSGIAQQVGHSFL